MQIGIDGLDAPSIISVELKTAENASAHILRERSKTPPRLSDTGLTYTLVDRWENWRWKTADYLINVEIDSRYEIWAFQTLLVKAPEWKLDFLRRLVGSTSPHLSHLAVTHQGQDRWGGSFGTAARMCKLRSLFKQVRRQPGCPLSNPNTTDHCSHGSCHRVTSSHLVPAEIFYRLQRIAPVWDKRLTDYATLSTSSATYFCTLRE